MDLLEEPRLSLNTSVPNTQRLAIQFVYLHVGITINDSQVTICAKVRLQGMPLDAGILVHHVRPTERGREMRSRFWIGSEYVDSSIARLLAKLVISFTDGVPEFTDTLC